VHHVAGHGRVVLEVFTAVAFEGGYTCVIAAELVVMMDFTLLRESESALNPNSHMVRVLMTESKIILLCGRMNN
jgi:hypothetical protein